MHRFLKRMDTTNNAFQLIFLFFHCCVFVTDLLLARLQYFSTDVLVSLYVGFIRNEDVAFYSTQIKAKLRQEVVPRYESCTGGTKMKWNFHSRFIFLFSGKTFSTQDERKKKIKTNGVGIIVEMQFSHKIKMFWFLSHSFVFFFFTFSFSSIINRHYFLFALLVLYTQNLLISVVFYGVFSHHGYIRLFNSSFYVLSILFEKFFFRQFFISLVFGFPCDSIISILHFTNIWIIRFFFCFKSPLILIKCHFPSIVCFRFGYRMKWRR